MRLLSTLCVSVPMLVDGRLIIVSVPMLLGKLICGMLTKVVSVPKLVDMLVEGMLMIVEVSTPRLEG